MAGTEKITEKIINQAKEQAAEKIKTAEAEAASLVDKAVSDAGNKAESIEAQAKLDSVEYERRILAVAELDARKRELAAKHEVLDEAFSEAMRRLEQMPDQEYRNIYLRIVLPGIVKGIEKIAPAASDAGRLGQAFVDMLNATLMQAGKTAGVSLDAPRQDIKTGCVLCDGGMEIDFSSVAVLRNVRERAEGEIARVLFPNLERED